MQDNAAVHRAVTRRTVVFAIVCLLLLLSGSLGVWGASFGDTAFSLIRLAETDTLVNKDFVNYWFAAKLAVSGEHGLLFRPDAYFEGLQEQFGRDMELRNWSYPPHALLFLWPLAFLPYPLAYVAFQVLGFAVFVWGLVRFLAVSPPGGGLPDLPQVAILLLPYVTTQIAVGQNGFWFAGIILAALALRDTRPWIAGLLVALLSVKPQLAVLVPVLFLVERRWTAIFAAATGIFVLLALSAAIFGIEPFILFATVTLADQTSVMTEWVGIFLRMMPTPFAFLRLLDVPAALAVRVNLVYSALMLVSAVICIARADTDFRRSLVFLAGSALVSPYFFFYDMGALIAAAALLALVHRAIAGTGSFAVCLVATLVCFLPWIMPVRATVPFLSELLLALPFIVLFAFFWLTVSCRVALAPSRP
ncbi:glycosyltransferase family 87 protein [Oricola thermophila]|uniref:DUF2029 domain-containing protein n=1 Tax=Oricola thermophila TaxID=2742145 RepID=A0A6N1VGV7_9HYPH|nr:glycosyltransferase family 87 protein [Oricola thermophila]QKV19723.1 DUF2029 domain-containing protein [Oricola thermophila]